MQLEELHIVKVRTVQTYVTSSDDEMNLHPWQSVIH
jgi:hypothetical protein